MERVYAPTLVAATFRHVASRNLDPQLHTHCVIANMTRDTNGKWRSIETGDLKRNDKLIGAFYRNELARRLRQLGFALAPTMVGRVPGFEIAGRDRVALEAFSSRRRDMLDYIAEKGWEYNAARTQQAALATRLRKDEPHWEVLTVLWRQRAAELGIEIDEAQQRPGNCPRAVTSGDRVAGGGASGRAAPGVRATRFDNAGAWPRCRQSHDHGHQRSD